MWGLLLTYLFPLKNALPKHKLLSVKTTTNISCKKEFHDEPLLSCQTQCFPSKSVIRPLAAILLVYSSIAIIDIHIRYYRTIYEHRRHYFWSNPLISTVCSLLFIAGENVWPTVVSMRLCMFCYWKVLLSNCSPCLLWGCFVIRIDMCLWLHLYLAGIRKCLL